MGKPMFGSLTRIADLPEWPFPYERIHRSEWAAGDYVVAEVIPHGFEDGGFELSTGRAVHPMGGDLLIGAFARRFATLEATGSFEEIGDDGVMNCLTEGGCFGKATSVSRFCEPMMPVRYCGHVLLDGKKVNMRDFVPEPPDVEFAIPVVLLVGTSMSAGKTFAGRVAVRQLKELGHTVVAAKLTGAGRWHDTLTMGEAGADFTFDFVDAGLPTTVCPADEYREAMGGLLKRIAATGASVAVIEAGASPLEPYNGGTLVEMIDEHIAFTILAASDPYAVVGIQQGWRRDFDLVTGPTANTKAGVQLVHELTHLPALDILDYATHGSVRQRLQDAIGAKGDA
jgi:hypothetical protein